MKEMVLYYASAEMPHAAKLKSVLLRMGVRIKNVLPDQTEETVGFLVGLPGFEKKIPDMEGKSAQSDGPISSEKQSQEDQDRQTLYEAERVEGEMSVQSNNRISPERRSWEEPDRQTLCEVDRVEGEIYAQSDNWTRGETEESLSGQPGEEASALPAEVLVMYRFSSSRIDELLLNLRRAGVPRIALKAVVTEYNSHWTFRKLCEELQKEHKAMTPPRGGGKAAG